MSGSILLVEHLNAAQGNIITESVNSGKDVYLSGIMMQADIQNRNGRIYPLNEMKAAVDTMNKAIKEYGGVFGELDHPADRLIVNLKEVSHAITELTMRGSDVYGKMVLTETPMGDIARGLAKTGVRFGVSSRGSGMVNENAMVSNFNLQTIDIVATPSAQGAYPMPVMESLHESKVGARVLTLAEALRQDPAAQKYFMTEIKQLVEQMMKYQK
jgi:hypothetical protein